MSEQFNLVKQLADLHNKEIKKHTINLVKMPRHKKKEDDDTSGKNKADK